MKKKGIKIKKPRGKFYWLHELIRWGAFSVFLACVIVIFAESAMPGGQSGQQSGNVTDVIEGGINNDYDDKNLIDIEGFDIYQSPVKDYYYINDVIKYTITYYPTHTSYKNLIWNVNDTSLVTIDQTNSTITCLKAGTVEIEVTSEKEPGLRKNITFDIKEIPVESVTIPDKTVTLNINGIYVINPTVLPDRASNKQVSYSSSNDAVATVDSNGVVTAKSAGTAEILVSSVSNPEVNTSLSVTVNKSISYDVNMISHKDVDIYPSQTITSTGTFGPKAATFSLNNLSIEKTGDTNNAITITKKSVNAAATSFSLTIKCKNDMSITDSDVHVKLSYDSNGVFYNTTFVIHIHHVEEINSSLIDESKITSSYEAKIYNNTYYTTATNKTADSITIKIPYLSSVTSAEYKYNKNLFTWETSSNVKISSKNYKQAVIKPNSLDECEGWVKYTPNKNIDYSITFTFKYVVVEDSSRISDITFNNLYTMEQDNMVNELFVDQEYLNVMNYKITATGGKFNSSFSSSGIYFSIPESSQDKIEFIYEDTTIVGIKTLNNPGTAEILAVSKYETDINYSNVTTRTIKFNITDKPNLSRVFVNDQEYVDLTTPIVLERDEEIVVDYKVYNVVTLKNCDSVENEIILPFVSSIDDESVISYNNESKIIAGIAGGTANITFGLEDTSLASLNKTVSINVNYIPVDKNSIKMSFHTDTINEYNSPTSDFSKVPVGQSFHVEVEVNEDATNGTMQFASSDSEIIEIDQVTGEAIAKAVGTATITTYSIEDPSIYSEKTIKVVNTSSPFLIEIDDLDSKNFKEQKDTYGTVVSYDATLSYGKSYQIKIRPLIKCSSTKFTVEYKSAHGNVTEKIATLDQAGNISLKDIGTTTFKITFGDDDCLSKYSVYLNLKIERSTAYTTSQLHTLVRKLLGHYGLFLCTAIPGLIWIAMTFKSDWKKLIATGIYVVVGFTVAGVSELIQKFTPGRGPSWKDVGIDFAGFMTSIGVFVVCLFIFMLIKHLIKLHKAKVTASTEVQKQCKSEAQLAYEKRKLEKQLSKKSNKKKKRK